MTGRGRARRVFPHREAIEGTGVIGHDRPVTDGGRCLFRRHLDDFAQRHPVGRVAAVHRRTRCEERRQSQDTKPPDRDVCFHSVSGHLPK